MAHGAWDWTGARQRMAGVPPLPRATVLPPSSLVLPMQVRRWGPLAPCNLAGARVCAWAVTPPHDCVLPRPRCAGSGGWIGHVPAFHDSGWQLLVSHRGQRLWAPRPHH